MAAKKNTKAALEAFFRSEVTEKHGFDNLWPLLSPEEQKFFEHADLGALLMDGVPLDWRA